jgi:integrase
MRIMVIDRRKLGTKGLPLEQGQAFCVNQTLEILDRLHLPDGFPFILDDDGGTNGCRHLNQYLLDAHQQSAFDLRNMRRFHVYHLARLLRFLRYNYAETQAESVNQSIESWLLAHGEPNIDLTDASRADLIAYRDSRRGSIEATTLDTEMGCLSSFYRYAAACGWITNDPIPRWNGRNTLLTGHRKVRQARFLSAAQTAHFLAAGLRGDGAVPGTQPASPERDYAFGLLLASTGLRREEGAYLLDHEVPAPSEFPEDGVHVFERIGKKGVTRNIYVTAEVARAIDFYRATERRSNILRHQSSLRKLRRGGHLLIVEGIETRGRRSMITVQGRTRPVLELSNDDRARAVKIADDGSIEPLGLFIARGLPPALGYWNQLFSDARERVFELEHPDRPPQHITVSPHTLRHTFAVSMLAALMHEGRERTGDPYLLLANPVLTVQQLLGHADVSTTYQYLYAAETWEDEVPAALRFRAAQLIENADIGQNPNPTSPTTEDDR